MALIAWLRPFAESGIGAAAEALFPANDYGAPDFRDTELVPRMLDYLSLLPERQRRLLVLLFAVVEIAAPLLVPGFRRFSSLSVERRERAVRGWRTSGITPLRILGDALKATLTIQYMSHPAALRYVGALRASDTLEARRSRGRETGLAEVP
jgi:hypothetical protein